MYKRQSDDGQHAAGIHDQLADDDTAPPGLETNTAAERLNTRVEVEEIQRASELTPNYKAAGADGIKGEFLRYLGDSAIDGLLQLYNFIFTQQKCPAGWTKDIAYPLYKQGTKRDPTNYRLITFMSVMAKVFERIMHTRLTAWTHNTRDPCEKRGFSRHTCCTQPGYFASGDSC